MTMRSSIRGSFLMLVCLWSLNSPQVEAKEKPKQPNIILIMADDQGYWDTEVAGNPHIETPTLKQMAAEGVTFTHFYANMVCAPTRAGLMTGRHYLRTGLYNTRFGGDTLGKNETTCLGNGIWDATLNISHTDGGSIIFLGITMDISNAIPIQTR